MQLASHSNASYLFISKSQSRASGVHFLSEGPANSKLSSTFVPNIYGIIHVVCKIMRNIMTLVAEVEYGIMFINVQQAIYICTPLIEMGWLQGPTPIQVVNPTAVGIANKAIRQK